LDKRFGPNGGFCIFSGVLRAIGMKERRKSQDRRVAKSKRELVERLKAEEVIHEAPEQLVSIFDDIDEGVYVANPETYELLYANHAAKANFGQDIVGKKCYEALHNQKQPCAFCKTKSIRISGNYKTRTMGGGIAASIKPFCGTMEGSCDVN
jgi:PAS domain-containing protein